jgi:hypothetical protein
MYTKKTEKRELAVCMMVNSDKIRDFLARTEAAETMKNIETLRKTHPNVTRDGRDIGSN